MVTQLTNRSYPTQHGDIVIPCPVCGKEIPLTPVGRDVWEVLYHNEPRGTPCNGTARRAALFNFENLRRE